MQCKFIKKDGNQCKGTMLMEDGFCYKHSPTTKKTRENAKKERSKIVKKFKFPLQEPLIQIRRNCLECCGNSSNNTMFCASTDCNLWYLRFGQRPKDFIRNKGEKYACLFDMENFKKGGKYDPDIEIEEMEL